MTLLVTLIGAAAAVAVHRLYGAAATMDTVYRDRVLCMEQLRLVREAYVVRIAGDVTRVRDGLLDGRQALSDLDDARQQIATQWSAYKGTYLVDRERGLIAKAEPLLGPCGTFADSPAKLAEQVDVLFTMLAHPDAVEQAALGENGFLNHLRPNAPWVDCSSVNPSFSKKMAAAAADRQVRFVDAPVTGSAPVAADAKLVFWVGAEGADLETIRPLLLCMGNKIVHAGGHGMGYEDDVLCGNIVCCKRALDAAARSVTALEELLQIGTVPRRTIKLIRSAQTA